jgi:hypothetical protein
MPADFLPFTWRWAITVPQPPSQGPQEALEEIQRALQAEGAVTTIRDSVTMDFRCPGLTVKSRWAILAPISSGYVKIDTSPGTWRLLYALRFTLTFWFALLVTAAFWVLRRMPPFSIDVLYPFLVLYGANVATSLWRFPGFLRGSLAPQSARAAPQRHV